MLIRTVANGFLARFCGNPKRFARQLTRRADALMAESTPRIRILLWSRHARESIRSLISQLVPPHAGDHVAGILNIVDELAKNAIRANHKFLILRRRIRGHFISQGLSQTEATRVRDETCGDVKRLNEFVTTHPEIMEGAAAESRRILNQEGVWLEIKNRYRSEGRKTLTLQDKEKLKGTKEFRTNFAEIRRRKVFLEFRSSISGGQLALEVINSAPILDSDLERIHAKRAEFKVHRDNGTEMEFFVNHMDTSEGGSGLGYATIDSNLAHLGFDPERSLLIISLHNTNVMLNLNMKVFGDGGQAPTVSA